MSSFRGVARRALGPIVILFAFLGLAAAPPAALAAGALCNTPSATPLCAGATSLPVFNSQHYTVEAGATIISTIVGATDLTGSETCTGGSPGVDVFIKSSFAPGGNQTVCGALSNCPGANCTITFSYTAPNGPDVCACMTSIVAYKTTGNNSTNDIIADGVFNGTPTGPAGFGFVDANGQPINTCGCPTTTTTTTSTTSSTTSTTTTTTSGSTTTTVPDHFQCYEVKPKAFPIITGLSVQDQFGQHTEIVRFAHRLCARPTSVTRCPLRRRIPTI